MWLGFITSDQSVRDLQSSSKEIVLDLFPSEKRYPWSHPKTNVPFAFLTIFVFPTDLGTRNVKKFRHNDSLYIFNDYGMHLFGQ